MSLYREGWIPRKDAADMLGLSVDSVDGLVQRGLLHQERPTERFETSYVSLWEVCQLKFDPEKAGWLRLPSRRRPPRYPKGWTSGPGPAGEAVLRVREAARLLDCCALGIHNKVRAGKLEGYKDPSLRKGGGCVVTERSVLRYRDDWNRSEFRRIAQTRRTSQPVRELCAEAAELGEMPDWMDAGQVADYLGIGLSSVYGLRARGRLVAKRLHHGKIHYLFPRLSVERLLTDPDYRERTRHSRLANSPEHQEVRQSARILTDLEAITQVMKFAPKGGIPGPAVW